MKFTKMHGLGNDFIVLDLMGGSDPAHWAIRAGELCDRHFGIGADGLVLLVPETGCDARMRIFNPDGTEPEMCGNAIRCAARYLRENGHTASDRLRIATLAGMMEITLTGAGDDMLISVDMGAPKMTGKCDMLIGAVNAEFMLVSTGNPHAVTYSIFPDKGVFNEYGPRIEHHPVFENGTNVEFCRVDSREHITVKVWERGAGETLACGTGATASFYAGVRAGILDRKAAVMLPGGELKFEMRQDGHVIMTGPAAYSFTGNI